MRKIFLAAALLLVLLLAGCDEKDPLIGTWQEPNSGITIQFKEDGNVVMSNMASSINLPYETQEPDKIIIKASTDGVSPDQTLAFRVEEDKLILSVDGVESVFDYVK